MILLLIPFTSLHQVNDINVHGTHMILSLPLSHVQVVLKFDAESLFWPMLVVAVLASIIASQSIITGTFSILQQSLSLGCFPRVKVVHTSAKYQGQVYVPEANYLLMLACVGITLGFRTTTNIGNAFGNIPKSTYSFSLYY